MLSWIFSIFLYLGTVVLGLFIDNRYQTNERLKRWFLLWLYIFLCFGYMVGTDWRVYESMYKTGMGLERYQNDPSSWFVFTYTPFVIPDYWILVGLLKCIYLYSTKWLVSKLTDRWMSVLSVLIPLQFALMLIEHPVRFTMAITIYNIAFYFIYEFLSDSKHGKLKKLSISILLTIVAVSFHIVTIVYIIFLPVFLLSDKIKKINSILLFLLYSIFVYITSNLTLITNFKQLAILYLQFFMDIGDYESYEYEDTSSVSIFYYAIKLFVFLLVILSKNRIVRSFKNGDKVYGLTVIYFFFLSLFNLVPTGFRFAVPLSIFYGVYIIYMIRVQRLLALILLSYTLLSFGRLLWTNYDYIPYSNSIPYIIVGHKPYYERFNFNLKEYKERTGETHEVNREIYL